MTYGELFAGCGGMSLGLERAGMEPRWFCEIDERPKSVLRRYHPNTPIMDDVCDIDPTRLVRPDLVVAGVPCQDVSVAGRRAGLAGERTGLFWEFVRIVRSVAPRWVLFENVPGLLSSNDGRDMGAVVGALVELGYGVAYRVLDAQWFGVPQRRRRVFIVGCLGNVRRAAEILFERESLPWDSPPGREAGTRVAHAIAAGAGGSKFGSGRDGQDDFVVAGALQSHSKDHGHAMTTQQAAENGHVVTALRGNHHCDHDGDESKLVVNALTANGVGTCGADDGQAQSGHLVTAPNIARTLTSGQSSSGVSEPGRRNEDDYNVVSHTLKADGADASEDGTGRGTPIVAFNVKSVNSHDKQNHGRQTEVSRSLDQNGAFGSGNQGGTLALQSGVRRLMPVECERLMGWPDGYTQFGIDAGGNDVELSDSARYRMIGNGVAAPVAEWIGRRIMESRT